MIRCIKSVVVFLQPADDHRQGFGGGGVGGGVKVDPIAFLIVKDGNVRMLPVATPANTTADRIVEMIPDSIDKLTAYFDSKKAE